MAEIDTSIYGPRVRPDYNRSAMEQVNIATAAQTLKNRQLLQQQQQLELQQAQDQAQFQKDYNAEVAKSLKPDYLTPKEVQENGGALASPLQQTPSGRPTLATPDTPQTVADQAPPNAAPPQDGSAPTPNVTSTTVPPPDVQPGVNGLPGPGGVGWGSGQPIQQISPDAVPEDRPSLGEMMGPVAVASQTGQPQQPTPADPLPTATVPAAQATPPAPIQPVQITDPADPLARFKRIRDNLIAQGHAAQAIPAYNAIAKIMNEQSEAAAKMQKENLNATTARHAILADALQAFQDSPDATKADRWNGFLQAQSDAGHVTRKDIAEWGLDHYQGKDWLNHVHLGVLGQKEALAYAREKALTDEAAQRTTEAAARTQNEKRKLFQTNLEDAAGQLQEAATPEDYTAIRNAIEDPNIRNRFPATFDPKTTPQKVMRIGMTQEQKLKEIESRKNPTEWSLDLQAAGGDPVKALQIQTERKIKIARASKSDMNVTTLSPEAIKMYADMLAAGKPLPNLGRGATSEIAAISNLAANKNVDLAKATAMYHADVNSLALATKKLDNLSGFETGALKNLKMFTDAASKIPDTRSPWFNTPVRLINDKLLGSEEQAAVNAARSIGLREIARITNDPNMSGQLTDTARKEVMDFSPADATIPQILKVAKTVIQDVANVKSGLVKQKAEIQDRIGKSTTIPPLPVNLSASDVGKVYLNKDNKPIKVTAVNPQNGTQFNFDEVKQP